MAHKMQVFEIQRNFRHFSNECENVINVESSQSSFQPMERIFAGRVRTAMDNVVSPRVEKVVTSITASSGRGPDSVVKTHDPQIFFRNYGKYLALEGM